MARTLMEFTAKEQERMNITFQRKIDQTHFVQSDIYVALGKFDAKINKLKSDISELKRNDKRHTEWYKLANARINSIINTCNRIEII
ncbi:hypothetical protein O181_125873, partial [Austropuccinia psidii MF-1]|nr:hypothetical protein [Austropuccinia psidii MF-1]